MRLAVALRAAGWVLHQAAGSVIKKEPQSSVPAASSPELIEVAARLQRFFDDVVAGQPEPGLRHPPGLPTGLDGGVRLPWASPSRPAEHSPSFTQSNNFTSIWSKLLIEIANGWAETQATAPYLVPLSIGSIFLGPRDRLIFWPYEVNRHMAHVPTSLGSVFDLFTTLDAAWGIKFDIKSAYRLVRVCLEDAVYLGASVDGVAIVFVRLPFGLAPSPAYFTAILAASLRRIGSSGLGAALAVYVDDIGGAQSSPLLLLLAAERLIHALVAEGWWISIAKTFLLPVGRLYYTGVIGDLPARSARLEAAKLGALIESLTSLTVPDSLYRMALLPSTGTGTDIPVDMATCPIFLADGRSLPPLASDPPPHMATSSPTRISSAAFAALQAGAGTLAWMQSVLTVLGFWRRELEIVVYGGTWTPTAVAAIVWLARHRTALLAAGSRADFPPNHLVVVDDGSATGWGARLIVSLPPPERIVYLAGHFSPRVRALHSTAREAYASALAAAAAIRRKYHFSAIDFESDSASLVSAATHGTARSVDILPPLQALGALSLRGIPFRYRWSSRAAGHLPKADAMSAAARPGWTLISVVALGLWLWVGGWDIHLCADEASALAAAYTTNAHIPSRERERMLAAIEHEVAATRGASGWMSSDPAFVPPAGMTAVAFPEWDALPAILRTRHTSGFPLLLIAPAVPAEWWGPALSNAAASAVVCDLPAVSSLPPGPDTRPPGAPDPRRLAAYWWPGRGSAQAPFPTPSRPWPPWAPPVEVPLPVRSPPTVDAAMRWVLSGRCPRDRPRLYSNGRPARNPPVPIAPLSLGRDLRSVLAQVANPPSVTTEQAAAATMYATLTSLPAPPPRSVISVLAGASPASPPSATVAPVATVVPPPAFSTAPATIGEWLARLRGFTTGALGSTVPPEIGAAFSAELATADDAVRRGIAAGADRPHRVPRYLETLAAARGALGTAWSAEEVDALMTAYSVSRLMKKPPHNWAVITVNKTVADDCSAIAALSRKAGVPLAEHCGPRTHVYLQSKGALEQPEHSDAYPFLSRALLRARPPTGHPDRRVWEALWVMSMFCLRTGVVFHVTAAMFVPYLGGYIFTWRTRFKERSGDVDDPTDASRRYHITAARHPDLHAIFTVAASRRGEAIFADVSASAMAAFVRANIPEAPDSFSIRNYSCRTGADCEAGVLLMPAPLNDYLFWWKREKASMRNYYSALNILHMFMFSEHRLHVDATGIGPGSHAATYAGPKLPDWRSAVTPRVSLPPINIVLINEAWHAVPATLIAARRAKVSRRLSGAPPAASSPSDPLPRQSAALTGACAGCKRTIGPRQRATACEHCDAMICTVCHTYDTDWFCTSHTPKRPRR